jgi:hypothetical protein
VGSFSHEELDLLGILRHGGDGIWDFLLQIRWTLLSDDLQPGDLHRAELAEWPAWRQREGCAMTDCRKVVCSVHRIAIDGIEYCIDCARVVLEAEAA